MCGIVGIHSVREPRAIDRNLLGAMSESITHRGPNSDGFHLEEGRVGLGMRRLSIIDVEGGTQPITNEDETVWIVFNGEIEDRQLKLGFRRCPITRHFYFAAT